MTQPLKPPPSKKKGTFPGVEEIKRRAAVPKDQRRPRGRPRTRVYTPEELAAMSPSNRRRALVGRSVPVMTADGIVRMPQPGSKLTSKLIEEIAAKLVSGASGNLVAQSCGITATTYAEWMSKGADPEFAGTLYAELVETVARARAEWAVSAAAAITSGRKGWQGRAWLAERMFPELGPPMKRLEHSGTGAGGAIRITGSVELPVEIPDGHPSLTSATPARGPSLTPRGVAESSSNGHAVPILAEGVSLPPEEDPD